MSYNSDFEVQQRVSEHHQEALSLGYNVLGTFLQGSWNYGLGYENSDVDTKAIVLPSFEDFVCVKSPLSHTHVMKNNEHLDLKDLRVMLTIFKKQNTNFLEILFTSYRVLNLKYKDLFHPIIAHRERVARYNDFAAINCQVGMIYQKYKALEHPYPILMDKIAKYGYDPKQLSHILRCLDFLEQFVSGKSYEECLIPRRKEYILEVKKGIHSLEEARAIAQSSLRKAENIKKDYFNKHKNATVDKEIEEFLDDTMVSILKRKFTQELK